MRLLFFNRIRAMHENIPISAPLSLVCLNSLRINENVCEVEMKNHGYALLSRSLSLPPYIINFCPKRTNEQTKLVRADKMDEPVDCLAASDHLLSCLPACPLARLP